MTERADTVMHRIREHLLNEYLVHLVSAGGDRRGRSSRQWIVLVVLELECLVSHVIAAIATLDSDMTDTNVYRNSRAAHAPSMPAFLYRARKSRRTRHVVARDG